MSNNQKWIIVVLLILAGFKTSSSKDFNTIYYQSDTVRTSDVIYTYPTPDELISVIEKENIGFNTNYLNPTNNVDYYIDQKSSNLNLGIYLADLAYAAFFSRRTKMMNYLEVVSKLSEDLLISNEIKTNLRNDLTNNIEDLDSIYKITNKYYYDIMIELEKNKSNSTMVIISTGTYIESIYLALKLAREYSSDSELIDRIAKQKNAFLSLYNTSKLYKDSIYINEIISYQEEIINLYNKFKVENKGKVVLVRKPDGTVKFKSGEKITITEEQFNIFMETIIKIRNEITKN